MPFIYPTSAELRKIEPDLMTRDAAGRVGLEIMPLQTSNTAKVRWSQKDNMYGLQHLRGMDGQPTRVVRTGLKTYEYEPGVFGEFIDITESELTNRAGSTDVLTTPINIDDLVVDGKQQLIGRELDRVESTIWTLLVTGTISIIIDGPDGTQIGYSDSYTPQTYSAPINWSSLATATPTKNFQSVQQLGLAAGHSVNFDGGAVAYMNTVTANLLINNTNANDWAGRRTSFGATYNNIPDINKYLLAQNLPSIRPYDQGYIPRVGAKFQKFIPDNKVVVIGQRPSRALVGNYIMTRNASNGFRPGSYEYVTDRANGTVGTAPAEKRTPANIELHRGHNGGAAIYYPSSVVVMTVG